ncbi:cytochrome P450 [Mycena leptocephala]|nr:cytochrome P450 [Mycena leptocephala]
MVLEAIRFGRARKYKAKNAAALLPPNLTPTHGSVSWHMLRLWLPPTYGDYEFNWQRVYGPFYRLKGCFGQDRLMVSDPGSLQYILNSPHFEYGTALENATQILLRKEGLVAAKAQTSSKEIIANSPVLNLAKLSIISEGKGCERSFFLRVIATVLGCSAQDLGEEFISSNFRILTLASSQSAFLILGEAIGTHVSTWIWHAAIHLPTPTLKAIRTAKYLAERLWDRIVREKTEAAQKGLENNTDVFGLLCSVLMTPTAGTLVDLNRSDKKRNALTPDELAAQTLTITVAGQDTTWSFPELQNSRKNFALRSNRPSVTPAALMSHTIVKCLIKDILRLYPAEAIVDRMAVQDTIIPLTDSLTTLTGNRVSEVPVRKGQIVTLAIASYQRLESRWGADAHKFNPSRWLDRTPYRGEALGPYANLMSFLGGPLTCLG